MNQNKSRVCYCNITYKCNNNCNNCISYNVKKHIEREVSVEDFKFFKKHFHLGEHDVWTISGGEPTLSDNFPQITTVPFRNHRCQKGSDIALRHSFLLGQFC